MGLPHSASYPLLLYTAPVGNHPLPPCLTAPRHLWRLRSHVRVTCLLLFLVHHIGGGQYGQREAGHLQRRALPDAGSRGNTSVLCLPTHTSTHTQWGGKQCHTCAILSQTGILLQPFRLCYDTSCPFTQLSDFPPSPCSLDVSVPVVM